MGFRHKIISVTLSLAGLLFFSHILFAQNSNELPAKRDSSANFDVEQERQEIYPNLRDRRCAEMTIDKCNCPDAREMKAYIDALIEVGIDKGDIFYRVARKFSINSIVDKEIQTEVRERLLKDIGADYPQIDLGPAQFDLGQVSKKQGEIKKIFQLRNKGNKDLVINNIRVSCSCVTVSLKTGNYKSPYFGISGAQKDWQVKIKPKGLAELEVLLDLKHSSIVAGKLARDIFISSNDPFYPEIKLEITAEAKD